MLYCTPKQPPRLTGTALGHDLFVLSDLGGVVQRISATGHLVWESRLKSPRGLDVHGNKLLVGDGQALRVLDASTGADLQQYYFDNTLLMARIVGPSLYVLMAIKGAGAVRHYALLGNKARLISSTPVATQYPRGMDVDSSGVYVADTFGHRVIRLDSHSLELRDEAASYFPNSVQLLGDRILVAEEHLNLISEFRLPDLKRLGPRVGRAPVLSAIKLPYSIRSEPFKNFSCATSLFSPNDAVAVNKHVYIADTDNHRIVYILNCRIVANLTGFNNPVNIRVAYP